MPYDQHLVELQQKKPSSKETKLYPMLTRHLSNPKYATQVLDPYQKPSTHKMEMIDTKKSSKVVFFFKMGL